MRGRRILVATALLFSGVSLTSVPFGNVSASAAANALSVTPSNPAIGAPVVLSVSNLGLGSVDFSVGGVPVGSAYVSGPTGEATITTALWTNGTFPVVATFNRYWGGVLTSTTYPGTVTVGSATPSTAPPLPTTSIAPTTTTPTTVPPTTTPTTVPPTGGISRYLADLPVVTGIGRVGETITCDIVYGPPSTKTLQWFDGNGQPIAGETGLTFVVRQVDVGTAVSCSVISITGTVGSIPLIIYNEVGSLPARVVTTSRTDAGPYGLYFTCAVAAGTGEILGYRFLNLVQFLKNLKVVVASAGLAELNTGMSCKVFVENRIGRVALTANADTSRQQLTAIAVTGSGRVGRTLTCTQPTYSPSRFLTALEWTTENTPPVLGGFPAPTFVGPATYVVQTGDIGKQLRCRARFVGDSTPFSQGPILPFWVYSAPVLARR
jgi:hypothetical protein